VERRSPVGVGGCRNEKHNASDNASNDNDNDNDNNNNNNNNDNDNDNDAYRDSGR